MKTFSFLILFFITISVAGQTNQSDMSRVYNADELTFYGYDFTHFKLAEGKRINDENVNTYVASWISFLFEKFDEEKMASKLKVDKISFNDNYLTNAVLDLESRDLVSLRKHTIPEDSIQWILDSYPIKEKEGIGFVIIIECFQKENEHVSAFFVFFDISTKQILLLDYIDDKINKGMIFGMKEFWGERMEKAMKQYFNDFKYRK